MGSEMQKRAEAARAVYNAAMVPVNAAYNAARKERNAAREPAWAKYVAAKVAYRKAEAACDAAYVAAGEAEEGFRGDGKEVATDERG